MMFIGVVHYAIAFLNRSDDDKWTAKEATMKIVIRVSDKDRARARGLLVRHSPGTALPNNTYIISEAAVRALRRAGIEFTEITRDGLAASTEGVPAGEGI